MPRWRGSRPLGEPDRYRRDHPPSRKRQCYRFFLSPAFGPPLGFLAPLLLPGPLSPIGAPLFRQKRGQAHSALESAGRPVRAGTSRDPEHASIATPARALPHSTTMSLQYRDGEGPGSHGGFADPRRRPERRVWSRRAAWGLPWPRHRLGWPLQKVEGRGCASQPHRLARSPRASRCDTRSRIRSDRAPEVVAHVPASG